MLRKSFDEALGVTGTCPENSLLYVALGAALYADKSFVLTDVADALEKPLRKAREGWEYETVVNQIFACWPK